MYVMYVTSIFQFDVTSISLSLLSFVRVRERGLCGEWDGGGSGPGDG